MNRICFSPVLVEESLGINMFGFYGKLNRQLEFEHLRFVCVFTSFCYGVILSRNERISLSRIIYFVFLSIYGWSSVLTAIRASCSRIFMLLFSVCVPKCTFTSSIQKWRISGLHLGVLWMISEEEKPVISKIGLMVDFQESGNL